MSCCSTSLDLGKTLRRADSLKKLSPQAFGHTAERVTQEAFKNLSRSQLEQAKTDQRERKKKLAFFSQPTNPSCLFPSIFREIFFCSSSFLVAPKGHTLGDSLPLKNLPSWRDDDVEVCLCPEEVFKRMQTFCQLKLQWDSEKKNARGLLRWMFYRVR